LGLISPQFTICSITFTPFFTTPLLARSVAVESVPPPSPILRSSLEWTSGAGEFSSRASCSQCSANATISRDVAASLVPFPPAPVPGTWLFYTCRTRPDPACVLGVLESSRFVLLVLFVYWPQYLVLCAVSSSLAPPTRGCCCCCCIGVACRRRLLVQMCQSTQPRLNPQWGEKRFTVHLTTHATPHLQCHHAGKSHAHSHTVTPQGGSELGRGEFASPDV
jgi:hypothetical protein